MRRHDAHFPHASRSNSLVTTGSRQFAARAIASATRRLPTPAGPASSSAGGSVLRAIARDSNVNRRRWPITSGYRTWNLELQIPERLLLAEYPSPEPALLRLFWFWTRRRRRWRWRGLSGVRSRLRGGGFSRRRRSTRRDEVGQRPERVRQNPAMDRARLSWLRALDEVFGVYRRLAADSAVLARHVLMTGIRGELSAQAANGRGRNRGRAEPLRAILARGRSHEASPDRNREDRRISAADDGARLVVADPDASGEPRRETDQASW